LEGPHCGITHPGKGDRDSNFDEDISLPDVIKKGQNDPGDEACCPRQSTPGHDLRRDETNKPKEENILDMLDERTRIVNCFRS
jgi:hypothetical protein